MAIRVASNVRPTEMPITARAAGNGNGMILRTTVWTMLFSIMTLKMVMTPYERGMPIAEIAKPSKDASPRKVPMT